MEKRISAAQSVNTVISDDDIPQSILYDKSNCHEKGGLKIMESRLEMFSPQSVQKTLKETELFWRKMDMLCSNQPNKHSDDLFDDFLRSENQNINITNQKCLNLESNSLGLKDSDNSEYDKEISNVKQVQIKELYDETESSKNESGMTCCTKPVNSKAIGLNLRSDVVNKTLLRAVKRFYCRKFKVLQKVMVNKRFKNVKTSHILYALTDFCKEQFECLKFKINYKLLAEFMMMFLDIKPSSTYEFDKSVTKKAKCIQDCMRKYSLEKFRNFRKYKEVRVMVLKIYKYDLEELFSQEKTMRANRERYNEAIEELIDTN